MKEKCFRPFENTTEIRLGKERGRSGEREENKVRVISVYCIREEGGEEGEGDLQSYLMEIENFLGFGMSLRGVFWGWGRCLDERVL